MFIIRNTVTGEVSEPFASAARFKWLSGAVCHAGVAGQTFGDEKLYSFTEAAFDPRYYARAGHSDAFDDEAHVCMRTPTTEAKPLGDVKAARKEELAAIRYAHETGGVVVSGALIATDRDSQAMLTGAKEALDAAFVSPPIDWKADNGFVQIDAPTLSAIAAAVSAHVQDCFSNEAALSAAIDACATAAEAVALDLNTGWPA